MTLSHVTLSQAELDELRSHLTCGFEQLDTAFAGCMEDALARLTPEGVRALLEGASLICMIGRGFEPVQIFLEEMPEIGQRLGEEVIDKVAQAVWKMSRTPNGKAIAPFLQTLGVAARRLGSQDMFCAYIRLVFDIMEATTGSIHGFHQTMPSPGLADMLNQMPHLLSELPLEGLRHWAEYGAKHYTNYPERQKDYFSLQSADSKAIFARERHGTLFADVERKLDLYMKGLWHEGPVARDSALRAVFDGLRRPAQAPAVL